MLLVFEALPVVALPPMVLPLTFALPLVALCVLLLETDAVLVEINVTLLLSLKVTRLVELGPVRLIEPLLLALLFYPLVDFNGNIAYQQAVAHVRLFL